MKNWLLIKRFCLIVLFAVLGLCQVYGAPGGGGGTTYYSTLEMSVGTGAGTVYATQDKVGDVYYIFQENQSHVYNINAEGQNDYVFDSWTAGNNNTKIANTENKKTTATITATSTEEDNPTSGTVTAHFVEGKRFYAKVNTMSSPETLGEIIGDVNPKSILVHPDRHTTVDRTISFSITAKPKSECSFIGWSKSIDGDVYDSNKTIEIQVEATSDDENNPTETDITYYALFIKQVATPVITLNKSDGSVTIFCTTEGATIYYTTDGNNPTTASNEYTGPFTILEGTIIKAMAVADGYNNSKVVAAAWGGNGTTENPYFVASVADLEYIATHTTNHFKVVADFDASSFTGNITDFSGSFDGDYKVISGLRQPLFASTNGATTTIKNVVLDDVAISGSGNVGAIVATASGATRIYNSGVRATNGSTISGTAYTGSIVGHLQGSSRVINCYSFADITGGTTVGGIVGYNTTASTSNNLQTLVMNCMYYGDITGGDNKAPIYNGRIITNAGNTGINNYNYYRYSSPYSLNKDIDTYNCALAAEERYLVRHEFYRGILNSQRKLCAFYVKGSITDANVQEIDKWVLDPKIAPYPIIKPWGRYRTLVNRFITDEDVLSLSLEDRKGKLLTHEGNGGYLHVTVNRGANGSGNSSVTLRLPITDMNEDTYDFNYAKVVLPFYNQYFDGNYTNNKVVTGWEISDVTGGTVGALETSGTNAYNYADRNSTAKDKGRIFAQGGYYNVPKGVTAITITAKWANAVYLSDEYYDRAGYDLNNLTQPGKRYENGKSYSINGSNQVVYTTLASAIAQLGTGGTVNDHAIVLVGNYHSNNDTWSSGNKPFTIMSADLDYDNEPDFCMMHYHANSNFTYPNRIEINPIRFDFLWHPGIGMAHKAYGSTNMRNQAIFRPKGWFEITETALARYTEFEYGYGDNTPLILNNGIFEQFVTRYDNTTSQKLYLILGGNVYMKQFSPGTHVKYKGQTKHCPVNILGGEYETFYLSGMFRSDVSPYNDGDIMCYTNGGKFGLMAGAGHEQINANVWFKINNSVIEEFYGGGINVNNPITGNIHVYIENSYVFKYCGGPMFGSMQSGKRVETVANNTQFDTYYGAGNGGSSLNRVWMNSSSELNVNWNSLIGDYVRGSYSSTNRGIAVQPESEMFAYAGGADDSNVGRFYVNYAKFDKAQTNDVSSTLNNCTILNDYYGGGNLGYVDGNVTSVLDGCIVEGSVYGGGFSAEIPTVLVYPNGFKTVPSYNGDAGVYNQGEFYDPVEYTWSNKDGLSSTNTTDDSDWTIWSEVELVNLGEVSKNTYVTVRGNSQIAGGVYGGGNASKVEGRTNVIIEADANSRINNVFGGANQADVGGETTVTVTSGNVGNVFGTNNQSGVKESTVSVTVQGAENATTVGNVYGAGNLAPYTGSPSVGITGNAHVTQDVYGGGLGATAVVTGNPAVTVSENAKIDGSVFGGGSQADITGNPVVTMSGGTVSNIFGGGDAANVVGNTTVKMTNGIVDKTVFGGGNAANVEGNTSVTILDGTIEGNVYGGGNAGNVTGATEVQIGEN